MTKSILLRFAAVGFAVALAGAASAQSRSADALRAGGQVGEQADGFMACVSTCDAATRADITEINGKRASAYREIAQRTGVTEAAAGQAAAQKVIAGLPSGHWYRPLNGGWTRK
jgi:uncharacterized protein